MWFRNVFLILALLLAHGSALASSRLDQGYVTTCQPEFQIAQQYDVRVAPSEAASIARAAVPGAKVLKVQLLPSGVYAVTLKVQGSVVRVMVSATDGSIQ